jgi:isopentenyl diphosphate isomerase/L-lactate dehydrogenase-like FMN-dependent dehydrogenase
MGRSQNAVSIEDLRLKAKRYLPGFLFDMIEGGVDDETGLRRNTDAFNNCLLIPRYMIDVAGRSAATSLFGRTFAMPYGISPTGPAPLFRRDADLILAEAATAANIPFVLSGAAGASMEEIAKIAPNNGWFQLYPARDRSITRDQIRRATDAGLEALVVTIDTPVTPKRERHLRNRISVPFKLLPSTLPRVVSEVLLHPEWFIRFALSGGMPVMKNWHDYAPAGASGQDVAGFFFDQAFVPGETGTLTWRDLDDYRNLWAGKLVVKGVMHPEDAKRALRWGADGIFISNHGGKAIDRTPSTATMIPIIRSAIGPDVPLMVDGGIRRGSDIVAALCLGADFVFVGRPTLYGVAADGAAGAVKALDILRNELDLVLAMIGATTIDQLGPHFLAKSVMDEA